MTYIRRGDSLGLSGGQSLLLGAGSNFIVPGSGPVVAATAGVLSNLFGGDRDKTRKAREQWFEQAAAQGSVIAARIMIGGTENTGGNEIPYYRDGINRLMANPQTRPTMEAAQRAKSYWDSTDNDRSDKMRALVENELIDHGQVSTIVPTSTGTVNPATGATSRAVVPSTSANANYLPWILGGLGTIAAAVVVPQIVGPRRNRNRRR